MLTGFSSKKLFCPRSEFTFSNTIFRSEKCLTTKFILRPFSWMATIVLLPFQLKLTFHQKKSPKHFTAWTEASERLGVLTLAFARPMIQTAAFSHFNWYDCSDSISVFLQRWSQELRIFFLNNLFCLKLFSQAAQNVYWTVLHVNKLVRMVQEAWLSA